MASGVAVNTECDVLWKLFHKGKGYRLITFVIAPDYKSIVPAEEKWQMKPDPNLTPVEDTGRCTAALADLLLNGTAEEKIMPRWVIIYYDFKTSEDGRKTGKEVMVKWCPEGAKVKARMTFSSSTKGLTDSLTEFRVTAVQADSVDEVNEIVERLEKGTLK